MTKVIIFGGSGFLGSHVGDKLSDAGYEVTIFDLKTSLWLRSNQKMICGNILDEKHVTEAVSGANIVLNFAGVADISKASDSSIDTVKHNILGNVIILEACKRAGIKRYIFASSVYVYSNSGGFYRCSKQACELYIEAYHEKYELEYTILRYGSLYGPRADDSNAIYRFVSQALHENKISYFGSPDALREYIHVEDAAQCTVDILKPEYANLSIVLTGPQPMKVGDVLRMISEILQQNIELEFNQNPSNPHYEITPYSFNPKVGKKLSPRLHVDLGQGILRVIEEQYKKLHPEKHI